MLLKEFKSWLEGVEDMQDDDWTPSDIQWKKIRKKIDELEENPQTSTLFPHTSHVFSPRTNFDVDDNPNLSTTSIPSTNGPDRYVSSLPLNKSPQQNAFL